jgi:SAM-dependent methyltransferase
VEVTLSSSQRFTNRVEDYVRARPGYPPGVVATLVARFGLAPSWTIADVGAGTGISTALFLEHGCAVAAVEPNAAMRRAAVERLGGNPRFRAVAAAAEATTLDADSVDAVVAAQAFHWFDKPRFREECLHILRPGGIAALLWNVRRPDASPFAAGYEALVREFATDYLTVRHENVTDEELAAFFGGPFERHVFDNVQVLDGSGLRGRLLSSTYLPAAGQPRHGPMIAAMERLFDEHQRRGIVELPYDARLYVGHLAPS